MRGERVAPIVIAAGGTGGHFFPAEALGAALLARGERVVLMTDARSAAGTSPVFGGGEIHIVAGAGVAGRNLWRAAKGLSAIGQGAIAARGVLRRLAPKAVVGFGGYPCVAPMLAARSLSPRPVLILHDQNAVLGKANALLARLADRIALSFPATAGIPAGKASDVTGNPVRPGIVACRASAYPAEGARLRLLVLGGSLGASVFASLIPAALGLLPEKLRARLEIAMQCPAARLEEANANLLRCGFAGGQLHVELAPFFADVPERLAKSHLVVSRAGGSTVAELAVIGRPAVLIPLTINADQRANAAALAAAGGAVIVEQSAGAAALAAAIEALLDDPAKRAAMAQAAATTGIADAAERLADLTLAAARLEETTK